MNCGAQCWSSEERGLLHQHQTSTVDLCLIGAKNPAACTVRFVIVLVPWQPGCIALLVAFLTGTVSALYSTARFHLHHQCFYRTIMLRVEHDRSNATLMWQQAYERDEHAGQSLLTSTKSELDLIRDFYGLPVIPAHMHI